MNGVIGIRSWREVINILHIVERTVGTLHGDNALVHLGLFDADFIDREFVVQKEGKKKSLIVRMFDCFWSHLVLFQSCDNA